MTTGPARSGPLSPERRWVLDAGWPVGGAIAWGACCWQLLGRKSGDRSTTLPATGARWSWRARWASGWWPGRPDIRVVYHLE